MDAPFRGPRIGDDVTSEDRRMAEFHFREKVRAAQASGGTLSTWAYMESNGACNSGVMDYATRDRILREAGVRLPDT